MKKKLLYKFAIVFFSFFIFTSVNSKITYVEKQVTGIGEHYKMALRDALKEAISQVNGVTQETDSLIKTIEKTISDNEGDDNFSSTDFQENDDRAILIRSQIGLSVIRFLTIQSFAGLDD